MRRGAVISGISLCLGALLGVLLAEPIMRKLGGQPASSPTPPINPTQNPSPNPEAKTTAVTPLEDRQPALNQSALATTDLPPSGYLPDELVSMQVYEKCNRSVVHIATKSAAMRSFLQVQFREGAGSGSILDRSGLILTNQHVIDGAREVTVSLFDGSSYPAMLVGQDPETDIAVLKIDAPRNNCCRSNGAVRRVLRSVSGSMPSATLSASSEPCPLA